MTAYTMTTRTPEDLRAALAVLDAQRGRDVALRTDLAVLRSLIDPDAFRPSLTSLLDTYGYLRFYVAAERFTTSNTDVINALDEINHILRDLLRNALEG